MTHETQIFYDLGRNLAVRDVTLSNYFRDLHEKFSKLGKVVGVPDDRYRQTLADSLLYYKSGKWIRRPGPDGIETARLNRGLRKPK
jgi:hypothetical protein